MTHMAEVIFYLVGDMTNVSHIRQANKAENIFRKVVRVVFGQKKAEIVNESVKSPFRGRLGNI